MASSPSQSHQEKEEKTSEAERYAFGSTGLTHCQLATTTFKWNIGNFNGIYMSAGKSLRSKVFSCGQHEWAMDLYPFGREDTAFLDIDLVPMHPKDKPLAQGRVTLSANGKKETIDLALKCYDEPVDLFEEAEMDREKLNLHNDLNMKFDLTIHIVLTCVQKTVEVPELMAVRVPDSKQTANFKRLFNSGKFSDVAILCGEREFPAHKCILSAQSPVFAAMFEHDMEEAKSNEVNIADFQPDVVESMLMFMYADKITQVDEQVPDLLRAADKYCLPELKAHCELIMRKWLRVDNVGHFLALADLHSAAQLKQDAIDFILNADVGQVIDTPEWKQKVATNATLLSKVLADLARLQLDKK